MNKKTAMWASPHKPTKVQIESLQRKGFEIRYLSKVQPELFRELSNLSLSSDRESLARWVLSVDCEAIIQPAGDPAFQCQLGIQLALAGVERVKVPAVWYAFSRRVSQDIPQEDGTVKKVSTFRFQGWV